MYVYLFSWEICGCFEDIKIIERSPDEILPHPLDEASVDLVSLSELCVVSYHDAPFIRWSTSRYLQNSSHSPRPFWTAIIDVFTLPVVRLSFTVCLYIWYAYRLAGGTAADLLVHFPAKRSRSMKEIHPLVIAAVSITSDLSSLSSGTPKRRVSVSQVMPKNASRVVGSSTHVVIDMK